MAGFNTSIPLLDKTEVVVWLSGSVADPRGEGRGSGPPLFFGE